MKENGSNGLNCSLLLLFFSFIFLMNIVKVWDGDVWWHLKCGEVIVKTQGLPEKDIFSFTGGDRLWIHDEWLGEVIFYSVYRITGVNGLILFTAAISTFIFLILYLTARMEGAGTASSVIFLTAAAFAMRSRLSARPEIFTLLFAAVFIYIIRRQFLKPRSHIWLLPFLQIIWVNLHPGALLGAILIAAAILSAVISEAIHRLKSQHQQSSLFPRSMLLIPILSLSLIACLANPYGLHGLTAPFEFANTAIFLKHIYEWTPITLKQLAHPGGTHYLYAFEFLLIFGALSFIILLRRADAMRLVLFLLTAAMALKAHRFIGVFSIAAAPIAAAQASTLSRSFRLPRCMLISTL
ncbi:MAG: hypothetical protein AB1546_03115, partial [bacterium]